MNIRFYHARILTMAEGMKITEGELHVKGNRITYVGAPGKKAGCAEGGGKECSCEGVPDSVKWDREIDAGGNLLMPGFKNAHTHSGMTFLRSFADDLPLQAWLNEQIFPMEAKLTGEDIYELSKLAILEYLTSIKMRIPFPPHLSICPEAPKCIGSLSENVLHPARR